MIGASDCEGGRAFRLRGGIGCALWVLALASAATPASAALSVTAEPALYPAFDPAVTDYVTRCTAGTPVDVSVSATAGTEANVDAQGRRAGDFTAKVHIVPGQAFRIVATTGAATATYYVRCLPGNFPPWTFQRTGQPQAEWYMVAPDIVLTPIGFPAGISRTYVAIFDGNGVPVWWRDMGQFTTDFHLLPNGNLASMPRDTPVAEERRLDGSLVRSLSAASGTIDPHDFVLLPSGNYLVTTLRLVPGVDVCGQTNVTITDNGIQELTPSGLLVWEWWAADHIPVSEAPSEWCSRIRLPDGSWDPYHINSAAPDGNGHVMSFRHLDAIYRVDRASGNITWKIGGSARPESLTVLNDPIFTAGGSFAGQHDARVLGDGTVTIHDNGFHPNFERAPRAVRYALDLSARTATLIEQKNDPGTVPSPLCCGSARRLAGGGWVMSWGSAALITELTASGARVFSLTFPNQLSSYRADPVPPGTLARTALRDGMEAQFPRGFPRPNAAREVYVPLVPAFAQCTAPNRSHGAPLAFGSCTPPVGASGFLTVGTPDANGAPLNANGFVVYRALLGDTSTPANEADVRVRVSLTDVRRKSNLSDYTGELRARVAARITDRLNGSLQNEGATALDAQFPVTVPCTATTSTTDGASCTVLSTLNAVTPGAVVEGKRAVWELGQIQVFDGGQNGVAGASDATLFQKQGLLVP
jgi:hypothetical protein